MQINIIAAVDRNRAIGYQNKLLDWLPNDMKRFKSLTTGHTIIMGRKTYESLPKGALPNRRNIVLSRSAKQFPGCDCFSSLKEALSHCNPEEEVYIIGGASVYKQALSVADRLCMTEVNDIPEEADAFFPPYDDWKMISSEKHEIDEKHQFEYTFADYIRRSDAHQEPPSTDHANRIEADKR